MKSNFTIVLCTILTLFTFSTSFSQEEGDYRSIRPKAGVADYDWGNRSNWQRHNGITWENLASTTHPLPSAATARKITITAGDSIRLTNASTVSDIDFVVVEAAGNLRGSLLIFFTTITLLDSIGINDIEVDGNLTLSTIPTGTGTNLIGAGSSSIHIGSGGHLHLNNFAPPTSGLDLGPTLSANAINDGLFTVTNNVTINGSTVTVINRGLLIFASTSNKALILNNRSTLINEGTIVVSDPVNRGISKITGTVAPTAGGNFVNDETGKIILPNNAQLNALDSAIQVTNTGRIEGSGSYNFENTGVNNGVINPRGTGIDSVTVNKNFVNGKTVTFQVNLSALPGGPGLSNDYIKIAGGGTYFVGFDTLEVIDHIDAPTGIYTVLRLITDGAQFVAGPFIKAPPNVSVNQVNGNTYTVSKIFPLPLNWGLFTAVSKFGNQVGLNWTTLQETNTAYFDVQWSTDGLHYRSLGTVTAAGNSDAERAYSFTHSNPDLSKNNYYRIRQVDLDQKQTYSGVNTVRFNNGRAVAVIAAPNPVTKTLTLIVQDRNIQILLTDMYGRILHNALLQPGTKQLDVSGFAPGLYNLGIFQDGRLIETQKILKR